MDRKRAGAARKLRSLFALAVLLLMTLFFLFFAGGREGGLPWWQAVPSVLRLWAGALILAASAALAGRVYCSVLCPLGTLQELIWRAGKRSASYRKPSQLRYWVLGGVVVAAAAGYMFPAAFLDPYAAFGRGVTHLLRPLAIGGNNMIATFLEERGVYGLLYRAGRSPLLPGVLWGTALFFALLGFWSFFRGRPFCDALCPVGTFLGLFSASPVLGVRFDGERCVACGRCESVCPEGCISVVNRRVETDRCILCLRCLDACPAGGLKLGRLSPREGLVRRGALRFGLGALAALGAALRARLPDRTVSASASSREERLPISPPGSGSHGNFTKKCVACTACVTACPAGIIRPSLSAWGMQGIFQPELDYSKGYCQFECAACSSACPTGAIAPLTLDEKKRTSIGRARFFRRNCIVRKYGQACGACSEHCPTQAVRMVPFRRNLTIPEVDPTLCLGCGACEYACPAEPKAITVSGVSVHGKIRDRKNEGAEAPVVAPLEEFPF